MFNKAQLERFFVGSVMLAFISLVLSIVGIKPQLFQNIQYLLLIISSVIVLLVGIQAKSINFFSNRAETSHPMICFCSLFEKKLIDLA
jgi:hypothetical protein